MQAKLVALALSGLGRDAVKVAATLILAILMALAFVIASLGALFGVVTPAELPPNLQTEATATELGARVVELAYGQIGMPYVWGGASPETSFDCSGLVQWVYRQAGVSLPRTAQQQYNWTQRISRDDLGPGDTVYFQICCQPPDTVTHVGIYIGNGRMIHSPTPGQVVREESITTPYWQAHWAGGGRVRLPSQGSSSP